MPSRLTYPLFNVPLVDSQGFVVRPWQQLLQALFMRVGQDLAMTNLELEGVDTIIQGDLAETTILVEALEQLSQFERGPAPPALDTTLQQFAAASVPNAHGASRVLADLFGPLPRDRHAVDIERLFDDRGMQAAMMAAMMSTTLAAGTYTPTLTPVANLTGYTPYQCQYMRVGSVVTVSGIFDADATLFVLTSLGISLPIASALASAQNCAGTHGIISSTAECGTIYGDATNARAQADWVPAGSLSNIAHPFMFTYLII